MGEEYEMNSTELRLQKATSLALSEIKVLRRLLKKAQDDHTEAMDDLCDCGDELNRLRDENKVLKRDMEDGAHLLKIKNEIVDRQRRDLNQSILKIRGLEKELKDLDRQADEDVDCVKLVSDELEDSVEELDRKLHEAYRKVQERDIENGRLRESNQKLHRQLNCIRAALQGAVNEAE
jgi:chromosome segregation ATPase